MPNVAMNPSDAESFFTVTSNDMGLRAAADYTPAIETNPATPRAYNRSGRLETGIPAGAVEEISPK